MFKNKNGKYEALGFVEAMIAIMVVGISSVVLMQIAVRTMQSVLQNEAIDNLTQYAVEGAEFTQQIALRDGAEEEDLFPSPGEDPEADPCFPLVWSESEGVHFLKNEAGEFVVFTETEDRDSSDIEGGKGYKDVGIFSEDDEFFRVVCLEPSGTGQNFAMARIVVGQRASSGTVTKGNLAKDYTYLSIIKLPAESGTEDEG